MKIAGIDVSSLAIDVVWIDLDDQTSPEWRRWQLVGEDAWERCRYIGKVFPGPNHTVWDETTAVGLEVAFGPSSGAINRCVGAVLSRLPHDVLVEPWPPAKWRKAVGLPGNASKADVHYLAYGMRGMPEPDPWRGAQDAFDAFAIALATRHAITRKQAA